MNYGINALKKIKSDNRFTQEELGKDYANYMQIFHMSGCRKTRNPFRSKNGRTSKRKNNRNLHYFQRKKRAGRIEKNKFQIEGKNPSIFFLYPNTRLCRKSGRIYHLWE